MQLPRLLLPTVGAVALAVTFAPNAVAQSGGSGIRASVMPSQRLAITIRPAAGMNHGEHVTPMSFAVEPGLPVQVTFTNYTAKFHTFTAPGLGVSALIRPAHGSAPTKTTITFTAHGYGAFAWSCVLCPGKGGDNGAAMRGNIYAIVQV